MAGASLTLPTTEFLQGGVLQTGPRQMFIQAIDDGGMLSAIDSTRWMVRSPGSGGRHPNMGRLLLIDDQPANAGLNSQNYTADTLYYHTAARNLLPGQYSLLQLEFTNPFRSQADMLQTFQQFDAVVWYIGGLTGLLTYETTLATYQDAIGPYLDSGGSLYLEGLNLIDTPRTRGPLRGDLVTSRLGSDFLFQHQVGLSLADSSADWATSNRGKVVTAAGDTLQFSGILTSGLRCFGVRDDSYALVWAPPAPTRSLTPVGALPFSVPVAVSVPQSGGGRFALVTFPLQQVASSNPAFQNSHKFLAQVFQQLGLTTP